jgi:hypothetical protein
MRLGRVASMRTRWLPRLGWALCALTALLWALSLVFWALANFPPIPGAEPGSGTGGPLARLLFVVIFVAIAVLGGLIVGRDPGNPIGWICCAVPILQVAPTLESDVASFLIRVPSSAPLAVAIGWFASWSVFAGTALVAPVLLLLPTGRLPSPRWRAAIWFGLFSVVLAAAS